jgi:hypothetical protein
MNGTHAPESEPLPEPVLPSDVKPYTDDDPDPYPYEIDAAGNIRYLNCADDDPEREATIYLPGKAPYRATVKGGPLPTRRWDPVNGFTTIADPKAEW